MYPKKILFIFCSLLFISACTRTEKRYVVKVAMTKLQKENMYDHSVINDFIFDAEESGTDSVRNAARKSFLKAADLYKNKKDINGAIAEFKHSILIFPEAKTYYELGNALLDASNIKEAKEAFGVAGELKFEPKAMVSYKMACAYNMEEDSEENQRIAINRLANAFTEGFSDTAMIKRDPRLVSLVNTPGYQAILIDARARANAGNSNALFNVFVHSFPSLDGSSFELSPYGANVTDYKTALSYEFAPFVPEMENRSFGRDVTQDFFIVGKLAETPGYIALVYYSMSFMGDGMQPTFIKLVTYSKDGKIIASKMFAGQIGAENVRYGKFANTEFTVTDYKRTWEKPIDEVSFSENRVKNYESVANATYTIQPDGNIVIRESSRNFKESITKLN